MDGDLYWFLDQLSVHPALMPNIIFLLFHPESLHSCFSGLSHGSNEANLSFQSQSVIVNATETLKLFKWAIVRRLMAVCRRQLNSFLSNDTQWKLSFARINDRLMDWFVDSTLPIDWGSRSLVHFFLVNLSLLISL